VMVVMEGDRGGLGVVGVVDVVVACDGGGCCVVVSLVSFWQVRRGSAYLERVRREYEDMEFASSNASLDVCRNGNFILDDDDVDGDDVIDGGASYATLL